ncbi:AAA family ATPase [Paenibacillus thalictri]|uniref:AAA family ATPase n=1 Tax=Paenibacillus thalictri TaxID=2527873 RepID=A0A4Q9DUY9_9BACL|nr:AAA family ATPase [Paenibacillus thalictri]TBL80844.1 AAA family ATPase [Paenibacillus thalictri]
MLRITSAKKMSARLSEGDIMQYIPVPELPYDKLKADFAIADHLASIDKLDLKGAGSVLIKCHYAEDGLLAAGYLFKKYIAEVACAKEQAQEDCCDEEEEFPMDLDDEDEDGEEEVTSESILYRRDDLAYLPVIPAVEFSCAFMRNPPFGMGFGAFNTRMEGEVKAKEPYWKTGDYPLIVEDHDGMHLNSKDPFEYFEQSGRFLIYILVTRPERESHFGSFGNVAFFEKSVLFETNMEYCVLERPTVQYYGKVLGDIAKAKGYKLTRSLNRTKLIRELMDYRGMSFRSSVDIETFVSKAIGKKRDDSRTITQADFDSSLIAKDIRKKNETSGKAKDAKSELDRLIGMGDVKAQLNRLLKRLSFDKQRRNSGYPTSDSHAAAVFMGSPGTAKTTVARIFGRMLCEANVLANDTFKEVSRKDLVGMYVGWTAPTVAKVFEEAKGGTIFIDEAYSLMSEGKADGYSDEALSEIIRQMENNPDTLVIFAGYGDPMRRFIQHANPGMRSRLTNVIEFKDYSVDELCEMFAYFTNKEDYVLENAATAYETIRCFVNGIRTIRSENMGNGRLIRKLFKSAVGYMAEREDNDLRTLKTADMEKAAEELLGAERNIFNGAREKSRIGFH